jgi:ABC-2 type transport system ATP-binding protein
MMITIRIPDFTYGSDIVLKNIELQLDVSKCYGLVGLNGSGKTSFFNLLAGHLKNEKCRFEFNNEPLKRKHIAFLETELYFYPKLTAKEFLSVFPHGNKNYNEDDLAEIFKLPLNGLAEDFSSGMKKKLMLMSQLKQDKDIFILDEPFNGLDLETNKMLEAIIAALTKKGKTVFVSSHILDPLLLVCGQIFQLKDQSIARIFQKNDFHLISDELFGTYYSEVEQRLLKAI